MKVVALDFGRARTGVAVSDPTGTVARPVGVVERAATQTGLQRLVKLIVEEKADVVVVGMPLTLRGKEGEQARETLRFAETLREHVDIPVECFDERFTTSLASRGGDAPEDARAAAHLLESYLTWSAARIG
jgi:putative Holliday junction resolvase